MTVIEQNYMNVVIKYLPKLVHELEKRDALIDKCIEKRAKENTQSNSNATVK